jgi:hypothetical protein
MNDSDDLWAVLVGVAGLAIVAGLALLGRDLRRAATTGPRWKRRLVGSALILLGALGVFGAYGVCVRPAMISCYVPAPLESSMDANAFMARLEHIGGQLPLLEAYAAAGVLDGNVVRIVLANAERDVYLLESRYAKEKLSAVDFAKAQSLCQKARWSLEKIRRRIGWDDRASPYFEWNRELRGQRQNGATMPAQSRPTTKAAGE